MKTNGIYYFLLLIFCLSITSISSQTSSIIYSADSLSGKIEISKTDYATNNEYVWILKLPKNTPVKITRINNAYLSTSYTGELLIDTNALILNQSALGEYSGVFSGSDLTFVLQCSGTVLDIDPVITIKFSKISNTGSSESIVVDGDLELSKGVFRASGYETYRGSKVAAILGKDYNSYTCFGAVNGGRIRGSNEGYLILEGNPNGYGYPTIYINRYVSNANVIMTSPGGRVGIGVDVPKEKLHIDGAIRGSGVGGSLQIKTEYGIVEVGARDNSGIHFNTTKPKFIFNQDIDVKGTIRASEVKIESIDNFPDYVFNKNYHLQPLKDLHAFIESNGHLPEIPTAEEVKENGINLVEMNKLLLKKIEELTLYIIDQDRKINILEEKFK